jgi:iron complex outermembrane recepter protein
MRSIRTTTSVFGLIGFALLAPAAAWAQPAASDDEASVSNDIVVTAQRREERAVDVPITITSVSAEQLATANVQALPDIARLTPGLRFDYSSGFFQPTIRGVGTPMVTSGGGSNVGIYVDNFYVPNPLASAFKLMNINSVDVLKGPQGTLFGRNTTGGAILVNTGDPSTTHSMKAKVSFSRFNEVRAQAYVTTGLTENIAVDGEIMYGTGDGWQTNISNGERVGDWRTWSGRVGLKADITDGISVLVRYQHSYDDDPSALLSATYFDPITGSTAPSYSFPDEVTFAKNEVATGSAATDQEFLRIKSDIWQGTIRADLGFADLASYTQYRKETVEQSIELDHTGTRIFQLGLPNRNRTWSQELLLTSKPGGKLQWTAGFFAFSNKDIYETYFADVGLAVLTQTAGAGAYIAQPGVRMPGVGFDPALRIGGSGTNTKTVAGFLDATYEVTPQLFVTVGARYAHDSVTDAYYNTPTATPGVVRAVPVADISSNRLTPRAVIRFKPNDRSSIYASFTQGYKASIIDVGGSCQNPVNFPTPTNPTGAGFTCNPIEPEKINAYEIGFKHSDRRLTVELAGFYYDYKNLQVSVYREGRASILNAATSRIYGLDGQVSYRFGALSVNAGAAWTHARYVDFPTAPIYQRCPDFAGCFGGVGGAVYQVGLIAIKDGNMQRAPEFTANFGAKYDADLGDAGHLALSGSLYYSSKFYFDPAGMQLPQDGYATLALRARWSNPEDNYYVAVFGDNVTNSRYFTQGALGSYGGFVNWSKPAVYGAEFGMKF